MLSYARKLIQVHTPHSLSWNDSHDKERIKLIHSEGETEKLNKRAPIIQ